MTAWSPAFWLWIAFRFFIFVLRTQLFKNYDVIFDVVNCFQIFYLCSSNTTAISFRVSSTSLWIAFRFFIFVLRTQLGAFKRECLARCELLSDFLSLFFEHNSVIEIHDIGCVVNCFQIFYLCSSNTTMTCWSRCSESVVNCFQIFYLCSSNTTEFAQDKDSQALMGIIPK